MPLWHDKLISENSRERLLWKIDCAHNHEYVTRDKAGQKEVQHYRQGMEGWLQRIDQPPIRVRLHLGFGWFTDREWKKHPEKCLEKAERMTEIIALGEEGKVYATRNGLEEVVFDESAEKSIDLWGIGMMGWQQTTPTCRLRVCYLRFQLNKGGYKVDWWPVTFPRLKSKGVLDEAGHMNN